MIRLQPREKREEKCLFCVNRNPNNLILSRRVVVVVAVVVDVFGRVFGWEGRDYIWKSDWWVIV
jgi:hypothetical protein